MRLFAISLLVASTTVVAPAAVTQQLPALKQIDRMSALPPAIQAGAFTVDGVSAKGWQIAEPGGKFSSTDVPVPSAPGRRLIFAACDARLCLIHYERGGIAHFYELLALSPNAHGWTSIWNVRGSKPIANLEALRAALKNGALPATWSAPSVKGDF